jgi:hypothetical protein
VEIPCCPNAWEIDSDVEGSSQLRQGLKQPPLRLPQSDVVDVVDGVEMVEVEPVLNNVSSVSISSSNGTWFIVTLTLTLATTAEAAATCTVATLALITLSSMTTEKFSTLVDIHVITNLSQFVPFKYSCK